MLPKITSNVYETTLPSTGQTITFRPYKVKEEKNLLIAFESGDIKVIVKNLLSLIEECVVDDIDVNTFTLYDFEYMFLQLRSKSIGETIELNLRCGGEDCNEVHQLDINVDDIKFEYPLGEASEDKVMLNDTVGVQLRHVPATVMQELGQSIDADNLDMESAQAIIRSTIVTIFDENEVYDAKNSSTKELNDFIESMSSKHLKKIQDFISNHPTLTFNYQWKCPKCGFENKIVLRGLKSFLE